MSISENIISAYREALRHAHGDTIADKSEMWYVDGWYYIKVAQRFPDESVGAIGIADPLRAKQIQRRTEELLNWDKKEKTNDR